MGSFVGSLGPYWLRYLLVKAVEAVPLLMAFRWLHSWQATSFEHEANLVAVDMLLENGHTESIGSFMAGLAMEVVRGTPALAPHASARAELQEIIRHLKEEKGIDALAHVTVGAEVEMDGKVLYRSKPG